MTLTTELWLIVGLGSSTSTGPGVPPGFPTSSTEAEKEEGELVLAPDVGTVFFL